VRLAWLAGLVATAVALPARADGWQVGVEAGAEVDSNVDRVEEGTTRPRVTAALMRGGGRVDGAGRLGATQYGVTASALTRLGAPGDAAGNGFVDLTASARWELPLRARSTRVGARGAVHEVLTSGTGAGARDYTWGLGEAVIALEDGDRRVTGAAGVRAFHYAPVAGSDWVAPSLGIDLASTLWRGEADDGGDASSLEIDLGYVAERRDYDGYALSSVCEPATALEPECLAATREPRSDLNHRVAAAIVYTGDRIYSAEYTLTVNDSSSLGQSNLRNRLMLAATSRLPGGVFATVQLTGQLDHYPDGFLVDPVIIPNAPPIEDENHSSVSLLASRRLSGRWTAEARWAYWTSAFSPDALRFERHLVAVGVTWTSR